ncbi:hypothetical protein [Pantoea sp. BAV 3049]|uniref:MrpH family fimbial adhesin n=1 Tax=Pantoea sp. BAV 3049 TaxID=2654188 RepID=UPI00131DD95A|nr:hypothetical protein [Pantoea sp. BAV 3049]
MNKKMKYMKGRVGNLYLLSLIIAILVPYSTAHATVFTQVLSATLQNSCHVSVIGIKVCYQSQITAWNESGDNLPNPCYGDKDCVIFPNIRSVGNTSYVDNNAFMTIGDYATIGDVRKAYTAKVSLPFTYSTLSDQLPTGMECAALLYGDGKWTSLNGGTYNITGAVTVFPTSLCAAPPPPVGACKISGDITIDYGSVSADSLSGRHATGTASIVCDQDTLVNFRVFSQEQSNIVKLRDDNSISAKLTIDGQNTADVGKDINLTAGVPQAVTIDSEAIVTGTPDAGPFEGVAIAVLNLP